LEAKVLTLQKKFNEVSGDAAESSALEDKVKTAIKTLKTYATDNRQLKTRLLNEQSTGTSIQIDYNTAKHSTEGIVTTRKQISRLCKVFRRINANQSVTMD
jgi:hypothetical protein